MIERLEWLHGTATTPRAAYNQTYEDEVRTLAKLADVADILSAIPDGGVSQPFASPLLEERGENANYSIQRQNTYDVESEDRENITRANFLLRLFKPDWGIEKSVAVVSFSSSPSRPGHNGSPDLPACPIFPSRLSDTQVALDRFVIEHFNELRTGFGFPLTFPRVHYRMPDAFTKVRTDAVRTVDVAMPKNPFQVPVAETTLTVRATREQTLRILGEMSCLGETTSKNDGVTERAPVEHEQAEIDNIGVQYLRLKYPELRIFPSRDCDPAPSVSPDSNCLTSGGNYENLGALDPVLNYLYRPQNPCELQVVLSNSNSVLFYRLAERNPRT